jgi:hypothetical protein
MMMMAGVAVCPLNMSGKWEGTVGGGSLAQGKYIEFTSDNKLLIRQSATGAVTTFTVTSVSGGTVSIQSSGANTPNGSFKYSLNAAKTEMTVSDRTGNGDSVGYTTYTKRIESTLAGTIKIQKNLVDVTTASVGDVLTAVYTGSESVTLSYQWQKGSSPVTSNTATFTPAEAGSYTVTVSADGYTSKTSATVNVTGPSAGGGPSGPHWPAAFTFEGTGESDYSHWVDNESHVVLFWDYQGKGWIGYIISDTDGSAELQSINTSTSSPTYTVKLSGNSYGFKATVSPDGNTLTISESTDTTSFPNGSYTKDWRT